MKKREIGEEILSGLEEIAAWQKGQQPLKTTELKRPTAPDVVRIRKRLQVSPQTFATLMGVSVRTVRGWEQGQCRPRGPARVLLLIADRQPEALRRVFGGSLGSG
jgi:putative transcriptional regulator